MSEYIKICEACGAIIECGDFGTTTISGGYLCEAHTPLLSEIVAEYNSAIAESNHLIYEFSNLRAMKNATRDLVRELTTRGDCNVAVPL